MKSPFSVDSPYNLTVHFLSHDSKRSGIILLQRGRNPSGKFKKRPSWRELNILVERTERSGKVALRWLEVYEDPVASRELDEDKGCVQICVSS